MVGTALLKWYGIPIRSKFVFCKHSEALTKARMANKKPVMLEQLLLCATGKHHA